MIFLPARKSHNFDIFDDVFLILMVAFLVQFLSQHALVIPDSRGTVALSNVYDISVYVPQVVDQQVMNGPLVEAPRDWYPFKHT